MVLLKYIDRFGAENVMGRPLGAGEMRRMASAEKIILAYKSREKAENWAQWAVENPDLNAILEDVMLLVNKDGE